MQVGHEAVAETLLLSRRDLHIVPRSGDVANNAALLIKSPQTTADEAHSNRSGFVIAECKQCLSWMAIDQLDSENLGSRKSSLD